MEENTISPMPAGSKICSMNDWHSIDSCVFYYCSPKFPEQLRTEVQILAATIFATLPLLEGHDKIFCSKLVSSGLYEQLIRLHDLLEPVFERI